MEYHGRNLGPREVAVARLLKKSRILGDCRLWDGKPQTNGGTGQMSLKSRPIGTHIVAYLVWNGPIPDGMIVHQTCGNGLCITPEHLVLRTRATLNPVGGRFWQKTKRAPTGCVVWTGKKNQYGYARVKIQGRYFLAHRVAYELTNGPIPDGLVLDHTCHNRDETCPGGTACWHRACVNPDHLEAVTQRVNTRRGRNPDGSFGPQQAACIHGHPYAKENTRWVKHSDGGRGRQCRECGRQRARRWQRDHPGYYSPEAKAERRKSKVRDPVQ